ncbi:MAG: CotS family spore coat protein [Clostridia bacterium]|nr:CotS family spore coat protein [Clostridia bacterium]
MNDFVKDYVADAQVVLKSFPIVAFSIKKYQFLPKKSVWFVKTNQKNYALKRYLLNEEQWQFMISAYDRLSQEKIKYVAPLTKTKSGQLWIKYNGYYYILSDWVKGTVPDYTNERDLSMLAQGIAQLHLTSPSYNLPYKEHAEKNLGRWPEEMRRKQGLLLEYKYEAENESSVFFSKLYLRNYQIFFELFEEAAKTIESPLYSHWVKKIKKNTCLCINGFSPRNFSLGKEDTVWFLHLDNICIDLPARDLRKLLFKVMYINNTWDPHLFSLILRDYLQIHPLTTDELKVLLAELKAPHLFLNIASKYYLNRKPKWSKELFNSILTKTLRLEYEKLEVLKKFWQLI